MKAFLLQRTKSCHTTKNSLKMETRKVEGFSCSKETVKDTVTKRQCNKLFFERWGGLAHKELGGVESRTLVGTFHWKVSHRKYFCVAPLFLFCFLHKGGLSVRCWFYIRESFLLYIEILWPEQAQHSLLKSKLRQRELKMSVVELRIDWGEKKSHSSSPLSAILDPHCTGKNFGPRTIICIPQASWTTGVLLLPGLGKIIRRSRKSSMLARWSGAAGLLFLLFFNCLTLLWHKLSRQCGLGIVPIVGHRQREGGSVSCGCVRLASVPPHPSATRSPPPLRWVVLRWLAGAHETALFLPVFSRTGKKDR